VYYYKGDFKMLTDVIGFDREELLRTALAETEARLTTPQKPKERVETLIEHMIILKELSEQQD